MIAQYRNPNAAGSGLGILPLILGGAAAAAAGAWSWNAATGLWEQLHLPGSPLGPAVPTLKPPPAPSAAGAAGTTWDQRAQDAATAADWRNWQETVFDPYFTAAGPTPAAGSGAPNQITAGTIMLVAAALGFLWVVRK